MSDTTEMVEVPIEQPPVKLAAAQVEETRMLIKKYIVKAYKDFPFYALLFDRLRVYVTDDEKLVPTACVTPDARLFVNHKFFAELTSTNRIWLMAHEIQHVAFMHFTRCRTRDQKIHNWACDYVINSILEKEFARGNRNPNDYRIEKSLYVEGLPESWTSEDVYDVIMSIIAEKKKEKKSSANARGDQLRKDDPGPADKLKEQIDKMTNGRGEPNTEYIVDMISNEQGDNIAGEEIKKPYSKTPKTAEEWAQAVQHAHTAAKLQGKDPAGAELMISDLFEPKIDWATMLKQRLTAIVARDNASDYSWTNPSRRWLGQDIIFPSTVGTKKRVAVWVDTSGSMYDNWMQAVVDIDEIRKRYNIDIHLSWQDSEVYPVGWISPDEPMPQMSVGGGGTSFRPVFDYYKKERIDVQVDAIVGFTDMWGDFPTEPPSVPTLWVAFSDVPAPFGDLITVRN